MTAHSRIAPDFNQAFAIDGPAAQFRRRMNASARELYQKPFSHRDIDKYATLYRAMQEKVPARIVEDVALSGQGLKRNLSIFDISLLLLQADIDRKQNIHYIMASTLSMTRFAWENTARPYPLVLVAEHLAFRKMQRTVIPFQYDQKFTYIAAAAVLLNAAVESGRVDPALGLKVLIPTKDGFYVGKREPNPLIRTKLSRRNFLKRGRTTIDHTTVTMSDASDVPTHLGALYTTIGADDCSWDEGRVHEDMRAILSPAKEAGLLQIICRDYAYGRDPQNSDNPAIIEMLDRVAEIMNSSCWKIGMQHMHRVHAPAVHPHNSLNSAPKHR